VAFALDPNRIYLNTRGRFPKGVVEESGRQALKEEISRKLQGLEFQGRKVIRQVFDAAAVYTGPQSAAGPDLIVLSEPGFDLKGSVKKREVFGRTDLEGMHTWDDAFLWSESKVADDLMIRQVSASILSHYK
jgi:predicted AlkP superfamily phosphohydrolase/phosphomutase